MLFGFFDTEYNPLIAQQIAESSSYRNCLKTLRNLFS